MRGFGRIAAGLGRGGLRLVIQVWPLWLMWVAQQGSVTLWREAVLFAPGMDPGGIEARVAYTLWPAARVATVANVTTLPAMVAPVGSVTMLEVTPVGSVNVGTTLVAFTPVVLVLVVCRV